jgi:hypothetical protein
MLSSLTNPLMVFLSTNLTNSTALAGSKFLTIFQRALRLILILLFIQEVSSISKILKYTIKNKWHVINNNVFLKK